METAVIILNYNGKSCLAECIDTLLESEYQDFTVILVDNASHDGSMDMAVKRYAKQIKSGKIVPVRNAENTGFAEGNNIGYRLVEDSSKYVALLNYDSIVPKEWLGKIVSVIQKQSSTVIIGSSVVDLEYKGQLKKVMEGASECAATLNMELANPLPKIRKSMTVRQFYVSGNGMLVRKSMFPTLFNPDYFAYAEDVDICWNAHLRGLGVILQRDAYLFHRGSIAKKKNLRLKPIAVFNGTKNQIVNFLVHWEIKNLIRIAPLFVLTQLAQTAYDPRKVIYKLKAMVWTVISFSSIMRYRRKVQHQRKIPDRNIIPVLSGILHNPDILAPGIKRSVLEFVNRCCLLYCRVVGLNVIDFQK